MNGQQGRGAPPRYSPDGKWWWEGSRWVPAEQSAVGPLASVSPSPRIAWVEDEDATGTLAEAYARIRSRSVTGQVAAILRTMSSHTGFLNAIDSAANDLHFNDGALTRVQHELIASYVAAISRCHY